LRAVPAKLRAALRAVPAKLRAALRAVTPTFSRSQLHLNFKFLTNFKFRRKVIAPIATPNVPALAPVTATVSEKAPEALPAAPLVSKGFRMTVGAKFLSLILGTLLLAVSVVVLNATQLFQKDNLNNIYVSSDMLASAKAGEVRAWVNGLIQKGNVIGKIQLTEADGKLLETFQSDADLISVSLYKKDGGEFIPKKSWSKGLADDAVTDLQNAIRMPVEKISAGALSAASYVPKDGQPVFVLGIPLVQDSPGQFSAFVQVIAKQGKLIESFSETGAYTLALVNGEGVVLAHPDAARVRDAENLSSVPIVRKMLESKLDREFQEFTLGGAQYLGAYAKVGLAGMGVVTQIARASAFEAGDTLIRRSVLIAVLVLSIAFVIAYIFAQTLVSPIRKLSAATLEVAKGNFKIRVEVKTRDEISTLAAGFNQMSGEIERLLERTADQARMEKELETAKLVQDTMFPPTSITLDGLEIQSFYTPAGECGGDWWGIIKLPGDKVLLAIGDATGHGVPAALVTATAKSACSVIDRLAQDDPTIAETPGRVLHLLNKAVYESTLGKILMTFFVAVVNRKTGEVDFATASHDPIYWYKMPSDATPENGNKSNLDALIVNPGPRLGQGPNAEYENGKIQMGDNDILLLYTDGLPEGKSLQKDEYGERKFMRSIGKHAHQTPTAMREKILEDFRGFITQEPLHDDVTLVVTQFKKGA